MKIFVAGAVGAVGLPMVRALCTLGHEVTGMIRGGPGVELLREVGASASITDAFDRQAVCAALAAAAPDVVIDQLTWLPADPTDIIKSMPNDTRLHKRSEEHTSELQSLMRISSAVFCLKKKKK